MWECLDLVTGLQGCVNERHIRVAEARDFVAETHARVTEIHDCVGRPYNSLTPCDKITQLRSSRDLAVWLKDMFVCDQKIPLQTRPCGQLVWLTLGYVISELP